MNEDYTLFDRVVNTTLINFMIEDQRNYGLALSPFDPNNINHLYSFEIALLMSQSIHKEFYLDMNLLDYWRFRFKNWSVRKSFKRYGDNVSIIPLELDEILKYMKKEMSLEDDVYKKAYETYYKTGVENRNILKWKRRKTN